MGKHGEKQSSFDKHWTRSAVVYQIYPRSFKDSNGDGIGDIRGIIDKLDYLNDGTGNSLGIEAIWISPIYKSPMADFGYDVADYRAIDPIFGDLKEFDELVKQAHKRGIRILMDFVPNHTSHAHEWFKESSSSKDNPKRDWYIWRDGKQKGEPPNNWLSVFGGSAWEYDEKTEQYYLHSFLKEQPDLNWRNEEVRKEMLDVLHFWLERGVDGFRTDAIYHLIKDEKFRDDPKNPDFVPGKDDPYRQHLHIHSQGNEGTYAQLNAFCELIGEHGDTFLVSETYIDLPGLDKLYQACSNNLHAPFNFNLMTLPWSAEEFKNFIDKFEQSLSQNQWPNYVMGNHDRSRIRSRLGEKRSKLVAMLLMTLRGLPFIYYGDEIGMKDANIPEDRVQDPFEKQVPGMGLGRDPERAPMQWSKEKFAGFSSVDPWLPVSDDYQTINMEQEILNPGSTYNIYKSLIQHRKKSVALRLGKYEPMDPKNEKVFAYQRSDEDEKLLVVLNFSEHSQQISLPHKAAVAMCSTLEGVACSGEKKDLTKLTLNPYEGYVFTL